jgi:hypothetical protein
LNYKKLNFNSFFSKWIFFLFYASIKDKNIISIFNTIILNVSVT